jgi:hypothetical protein
MAQALQEQNRNFTALFGKPSSSRAKRFMDLGIVNSGVRRGPLPTHPEPVDDIKISLYV